MDEWQEFVVPHLDDVVQQLRPSLLLDRLRASRLLTRDDYSQLIDTGYLTEKERSRILLTNILPRNGPGSLRKFCQILLATDGQKHIATDILRFPPGGVAQTATVSSFRSPGSKGGISLSRKEKEIFDRALKKGSIKPKRYRLNVVGRDRVGKSSFIDSLLQKLFDKRKASTDGVAIEVVMTSAEGWTEEAEDEETYVDKYLAASYAKQEQVKSADSSEMTASQQVGKSRDTKFSSEIKCATSQGTAMTTEEQAQTTRERKAKAIVEQLKAENKLTDRQIGLIEKLLKNPSLLKKIDEATFVHIWDFGGQEPYLTTHSALMADSERFPLTAYAIVSNLTQLLSDTVIASVYRPDRHGSDFSQRLLSMKTNRDFFEHWLTTVSIAHDPEVMLGNYLGKAHGVKSFPAIFPVGTHYGEEAARRKLESNNEILRDILKEKKFENHIVRKSKFHEIEFFCVDNTKSGLPWELTGAEVIRDLLDGMADAFWFDVVEQPLTYVQLERLLISTKRLTGSAVLTVEDVHVVGRDLCQMENEDVPVALLFIASMGSILYYPKSKFLSDKVFTDPRWVIKGFATFVSPQLSYDKSLPHADVQRVLQTGFMSWELTLKLLAKSKAKETEFYPMLELLRLFDIACQPNPKAIRGIERERPMQLGQPMFIPCLLDRHFEGTTHCHQWSVKSGLPPPLILLPVGVDMIPEALFFRLETRCIDHYNWHGNEERLELKRNRCVLPLSQDLWFELLYHSTRYISATILEVNNASLYLEQKVKSRLCVEFRNFLWFNINDSKQKGMRGLNLKLCCSTVTEISQEVSLDRLVQLDPYRPPKDDQLDQFPKVLQDSINLWYGEEDTDVLEEDFESGNEQDNSKGQLHTRILEQAEVSQLIKETDLLEKKSLIPRDQIVVDVWTSKVIGPDGGYLILPEEGEDEQCVRQDSKTVLTIPAGAVESPIKFRMGMSFSESAMPPTNLHYGEYVLSPTLIVEPHSVKLRKRAILHFPGIAPSRGWIIKLMRNPCGLKHTTDKWEVIAKHSADVKIPKPAGDPYEADDNTYLLDHCCKLCKTGDVISDEASKYMVGMAFAKSTESGRTWDARICLMNDHESVSRRCRKQHTRDLEMAEMHGENYIDVCCQGDILFSLRGDNQKRWELSAEKDDLTIPIERIWNHRGLKIVHYFHFKAELRKDLAEVSPLDCSIVMEQVGREKETKCTFKFFKEKRVVQELAQSLVSDVAPPPSKKAKRDGSVTEPSYSRHGDVYGRSSLYRDSPMGKVLTEGQIEVISMEAAGSCLELGEILLGYKRFQDKCCPTGAKDSEKLRRALRAWVEDQGDGATLGELLQLCDRPSVRVRGGVKQALERHKLL